MGDALGTLRSVFVQQVAPHKPALKISHSPCPPACPLICCAPVHLQMQRQAGCMSGTAIGLLLEVELLWEHVTAGLCSAGASVSVKGWLYTALMRARSLDTLNIATCR